MRTGRICLLVILMAGQLAALEVSITAPAPNEPIFGSVNVTAYVVSASAIQEVELHLDGKLISRLTEPPFSWVVEVGQTNTEHLFEVIARDIHGELASAVVHTTAVEVDDEVEVELQQLYVTAVRNGQAVRDLDREDFAIIDGGKKQTLVTFERGDVPLTALLLVDASRSMRGERLEVALASAMGFIDDMQPLDEAMLLLFSEGVVHATPFTGFRQVLGAGLESVTGQGGTALKDHLYIALKLLEERQGRRVVIVLSDGIDSASVLEMPEVDWIARRSQALVYWLRLNPPSHDVVISSAWRDGEGYRKEIAALEQLVQQSGGEILELRGIEDSSSAFSGIMEELRNQYVLGYYPSDARNDGRWRRVRVRAKANLQLRYRNGYIDY